MKWNNVKTCKDDRKHYSSGKLYCLDFRINKVFKGDTDEFKHYTIVIKNSKTKEYFDLEDRHNITFKRLDEAKEWAETYARVTYFKIYNQYKNWQPTEVKIPGKKNKTYLVFRPNEDEWKKCNERYEEWLPEMKNKFRNIDMEAFNEEITEIVNREKVKETVVINKSYEIQWRFKSTDDNESYNTTLVVGTNKEDAIQNLRNRIRDKIVIKNTVEVG